MSHLRQIQPPLSMKLQPPSPSLLKSHRLSKLHLNRNLSKSLLPQRPQLRRHLRILQSKKLPLLSLLLNQWSSLLRSLLLNPLLRSLPRKSRLSSHLPKSLWQLKSLRVPRSLLLRIIRLLHRNRKPPNRPLKSLSLLLRKWKLLLKLLLLQNLRRRLLPLPQSKKRQLPMHPQKPRRSRTQPPRMR